MTLLLVKDLSFSYESESGFNLSVPQFELRPAERVALIGPNGAGKTTFLQIIALLQNITKRHKIPSYPPLSKGGMGGFNAVGSETTCSILYNSKEVITRADILNYHRATAFVPQRPVLYNRSVRENVALGLKIRGVNTAEGAKRTESILQSLKIAHLAERSALSISGGEARRVMLARALVLNPQILFLDEPFADLDEPVRRSIIEDLLPILSQSGCATVFVTHNQDETYQLANRFLVMIKGRIIQDGTASEIFANPASKEVAEFIGIKNIMAAQVIDFENDIISVSLNSGGLKLSVSGPKPISDKVIICIPPESITISTDSPQLHNSARNTLQGVIKKVIPSRYLVWLEIDCNGVHLTASVTHQSIKELGLTIGKPVGLLIKATAIQLLPVSETSS